MDDFQNINRKDAGFTLIEVLIVILLTVIVMVALYDLFDTNQKIYTAQQQVTSMNTATRTAMERMVTSIRTAGSNNLNAINLTGKPFIAVAESNRIRVVEDLPGDSNNDGDTFDRNDLNTDGDVADDNEDENADTYINDPYEDVTYNLSNGNLVRTQWLDNTYCPNGQGNCSNCPGSCPPQATDIMASDIEALTFEYFSDTSTQLTAPVTGNNLYNVKLVRVTVDAKTHANDRITGQPHRIRLKSDVFLRN